MKTVIALLIGCSLVIAGAVYAQQPPPEGQESPAGKKGGRAEKTTTQPQGATETKPSKMGGGAQGRMKSNANATQPTTTTAETGAPEKGAGKRGRGAKAQTATSAEMSPGRAGAGATTDQTGGGKKGKHGKGAGAAGTTAETGAAAGASPGASAPMETGKKGKHGKGANAAASAAPATSAAPVTGAAGAAGATGAMGATGASGAVGATGSMGETGANATAGAGNLKGQGTVGKGGKKVEQQQIQQIKQQHANFKAQPKPNVAPAVTYNQNYRIQNSQTWVGPQYEVFRSYHPEWHDSGWYHSHYGSVVLIAGGWYFLNQGYWYPAWGYDQSAQYYAYDGPIYVGHTSRPPDQVIADTQATLQAIGYYTGEVDGLLGPLTRQALRDYQADHGLMVTEAIDQPTLDSLQIS
jgi:Putative peptidoglycan binding domain